MTTVEWVGIDVSEATLDLHAAPAGTTAQYANDDLGIASVVAALQQWAPRLIVLEATGAYHVPLAAALGAAGLPVAIVNPRQVRDFAKATGQLAKTDRLDAAVLALFAEGETVIRNVANLRVKETDRLAALAAELRKFGAKVEELKDGLRITPPLKPRAARVRTYGDHRMAMSFALAGLKTKGVEIAGAECVAKTFPDYFDRLRRLVSGKPPKSV